MLTAILNESPDWPQIIAITKILSNWGIRSFVVGGWVRDTLLNRANRDIDFSVTGDGLEIARRMAEELEGKFVPLDEDAKVGRVVLTNPAIANRNRILDFAGVNGESIEEDLKRRDFPIDAIAVVVDISSGQFRIIDPCYGLDDLDKAIIRTTTPEVFREDPIRLLRAVRLAAQLNFTIANDTEKQIRYDAGMISQVAGERIHEELVALLSAAGAGEYLSYLDTLGLLTVLIPELEPGRDTDQPREHQWHVLQHSLKTAAALDFLIREGKWGYVDNDVIKEVPWNAELDGYFNAEISHGSKRKAILRLAAVLHDNAKPQTKTEEPGGKTRFLGHAQQGAEIARNVMERLRFTNREIKYVELAVKNHLRPTQMGWPELPTRRAVYRFFRDTGETATGILFLSLADHLAMRGPALEKDDWKLHTQITGNILTWRAGSTLSQPVLIDGYDIMNIFGLRPSRQVGDLLEAVHEAQASGQVTNKEEAISLLREVLGEKSLDVDAGED
jgi:poly(A) polymerase